MSPAIHHDAGARLSAASLCERTTAGVGITTCSFEGVALGATKTYTGPFECELLTNAVKYTPANGVIGLEVACTDNDVHITVRDSGIGIAPDQHDVIFEAFRQADGTTKITRLVDAERASQVRDHLLADGTITIDKATTQECVELGKAGVEIERAAGGEGGAA